MKEQKVCLSKLLFLLKWLATATCAQSLILHEAWMFTTLEHVSLRKSLVNFDVKLIVIVTDVNLFIFSPIL